MTSSLTLDLIVRPVRGWQRLAGGDDLCPEPLLAVSGVAATSIALSLCGTFMMNDMGVGRATVLLLVTTAGYVGACVLAARLAPVLMTRDRNERPALSRYSSMAAVPVVATGVAYLAPSELTWWLVAVLGMALTAHSASVGARVLLHREAARPHRTAVLVTALASAPVLAVAAFRSAA